MDGFPRRMPGRQSMLSRAVNAMVRAMGGGSVTFRFPTAVAGIERELGIISIATEDVEIGPVVIRDLGLKDGRVQVQVLISASSLQSVLDARGAASGLSLLKTAESMVYGQRVSRVTEVNAETFGGLEYMWRVTGIE